MADRSSWFFSKKAFLFDLDGTLYLGSRALKGAHELLERLEREEKDIFYFTNNSSRSEADYVTKLKRIGFRAKKDQIVMSTHTLIRFLKSKKWRSVFLLGTPAMKKMLKQNQIRSSSASVKAVVVGFDKTLTYEKLKRACELIEAGIPYIVTHPDLYCPTDKGREPDCGAFAKVLEAVTEKKPLVVLGKPHRLMIEEVRRRKPYRVSEMVLIGDRLMTDIAMAKSAGIDSLLVLSGETTAAKARKSRLKATFTAKSVADLN